MSVGTAESRCPDCGEQLDGDWDVEFTRADQAYFENHPGHSCYTRPAFKQEHPFVCSGVLWVEVIRLATGLRLRLPTEAVH